MDYKKLLSHPLSKSSVDTIVENVLHNPDDFPALTRLLFADDNSTSRRALWACEKIAKRKSDRFSANDIRRVEQLCLTTTDAGKKRLGISLLLHLPLSEPLNVELINHCFEWMLSPRWPSGLQSIAMKYLSEVCTKEPGLTQELTAYLENAHPSDYYPAFIVARRNTLKALKKNSR
ncbi:MAG: hypothetical protein LBH80_04095 [Prevotellaceae bacterium]|jgi:hypothetical protein|nr:hypothetical protein [Prevotellaceae bacterium]